MKRLIKANNSKIKSINRVILANDTYSPNDLIVLGNLNITIDALKSVLSHTDIITTAISMELQFTDTELERVQSEIDDNIYGDRPLTDRPGTLCSSVDRTYQLPYKPLTPEHYSTHGLLRFGQLLNKRYKEDDDIPFEVLVYELGDLVDVINNEIQRIVNYAVLMFIQSGIELDNHRFVTMKEGIVLKSNDAKQVITVWKNDIATKKLIEFIEGESWTDENNTK